MKIFTKESLIKELIQIREMGWVKNARPGNDGGIGNTLEDLLGIAENSLPLPNAGEWELKTRRINSSALITLFHMEPSPRALKFVPNIFLPDYGWKHKDAGKTRSIDEKSFRQTISGNHPTDRGFEIKADYVERKIIVTFDPNKIGDRHIEWKREIEERIGLSGLSQQPYWGFDDLIHKAGTKLHNCFFAEADVKKIKTEGCIEEFYHYKDIYMLRGLDVNKFIESIMEGKIKIEFDARTGHNHGTKFRVSANHIKNLYSEVTLL